ncbi:endoplasmic reticulum resident protein 29 [Trichonephila clavipes]|nr:endoplasmic reticulum resident protein 29 [Trichonephila clavipes]
MLCHKFTIGLRSGDCPSQFILYSQLCLRIISCLSLFSDMEHYPPEKSTIDPQKDLPCHKRQIKGVPSIRDYGEQENSDIAERFGVSKDDFPVIKLFVEGEREPIAYSGDIKADDIKNFIKKHSIMHAKCPNTFLSDCMHQIPLWLLRFYPLAHSKEYLSDSESKGTPTVYYIVNGYVFLNPVYVLL